MDFGLSKYKDVFGKPKEGVHKDRFLYMAATDVFGTIAISWVVSYFSNIRFWVVLFVIWLTAIVLHRLFGVQTTIDKFLFPNNSIFK
jgi:succinate dehydrogenase hydrophobic anchor subunit